jgi:ribosomal protein L37AE/L43A
LHLAADERTIRVPVADFDLHQWFAREELERCPACGEQGILRLPASGSSLCIACGRVTARGGAADEHERERDSTASTGAEIE